MAWFQLLTNTENRLLTAQPLLKKRINLFRSHGKEPTLNDVNKTHKNFINATYKPYIATASDYSIVPPVSNNNTLGSPLSFNLDARGNFLNDIIFHCVIRAPDVHVEQAEGEGIMTYPSVRWADYPGERLMKKTRHEFDHIVADQYTSEDIVFHRQFHIDDNKLSNWKRAVGQQIETDGYINDSSQKHTPGHRIYVKTSTGLQTPKDATTWTATSNGPNRPNDLEVFVPLLFWYNLDIAQSIISTGNINIIIDLAKQCDLFNFQSRGSPCNVHIGKATIVTAELIVNNILIDTYIYDIFYAKSSYRLIRNRRKYSYNVTRTRDKYAIPQSSKAMTETLYFGLRPDVNMQGESNLWNWHRFSNITPDILPFGELKDVSLFVEKIEPTLDMISVKIGASLLYPSLPLSFYQKYVHNNAAHATGSVNFCVNPGDYQPSGITSSDITLDYSTVGISLDNPATLIISAIEINFLIYENYKYILRYTHGQY